MTFQQWMTLAAVVAGPAGVSLGWALSQLGESKRGRQAAWADRVEANQRRALAILSAASIIETGGNSLAHGTYIKRSRNSGVVTEQYHLMMNEFNSAMSELDRLILEAEVLGPPGLADVGRELQRHGRALSADVMQMDADFSATIVSKIQDVTLKQLAAAVADATHRVRSMVT